MQVFPGEKRTIGSYAGHGNFYQFDSFKPGNLAGALQVPASPPTPTWVIKMGIRYKF